MNFDLLGDENKDLEFPFDLGLDEPLSDSWLQLSVDFVSPNQVSLVSAGPSALLKLPLSLLGRSFEYLEWSDAQNIHAVGNRYLIAAVSCAWHHIMINSWRYLSAPLSSFVCGRMRSSLLQSVEQMRKGVVSGFVHASHLDVVLKNDEMEPKLKLHKKASDSPVASRRKKDLLVAKVVTLMLQTMEALVRFAEQEMSDLSRMQLQNAPVVELVSRHAKLVHVHKEALVALKRYRKKVVIPCSHLRPLRNVENKVHSNLVQLHLLEQGWKQDPNTLPVAILSTEQVYAGLLRPGQAQLSKLAAQIMVAPFAAKMIAGVDKCTIVCEEIDADGSSSATLPDDVMSNHVQPFAQQGRVQFTEFKFSKPTRQKLVRLVFETNVTFSNGKKATVKSAPTYPLLVYSHQKQHQASYLSLLLHYAFPKGPDETTWPTFVNTFNEIMCSQLLSETAPRVVGLGSTDLEFICSKYFGGSRNTVSRAGVTEFFEFAGPFLFALCFNRDYVLMWEEGYIAGFAPREGVDLTKYGPGSFLLRFSTGAPGELVISFVPSKGDTTKHYLIREGDVAPKSRAGLAVFLSNQHNLQHMLRLGELNDEYSLAAPMIKVPKMQALAPWLPKDHDVSTNVPKGYDYHA